MTESRQRVAMKSSGSSCSTATHLNQYRRFDHWTVNDGLSQGTVAFIHQDKLGFLWIGTMGGLERFDGIEFTHVNAIRGIPQQPVYFYLLIENADSTFWLSTDAGLMLFDPRTNSGELFQLPRSIVPTAEGLATRCLTRLADESFLFGLDGVGLVRFEYSTRRFSLVHPFQPSVGTTPPEDLAGIVALPNTAQRNRYRSSPPSLCVKVLSVS